MNYERWGSLIKHSCERNHRIAGLKRSMIRPDQKLTESEDRTDSGLPHWPERSASVRPCVFVDSSCARKLRENVAVLREAAEVAGHRHNRCRKFFRRIQCLCNGFMRLCIYTVAADRVSGRFDFIPNPSRFYRLPLQRPANPSINFLNEIR